MLQRWLKNCWKWSMFWKTYNKQNTWECWTHMGCNQQRLATDSVRTRSWSGDSKNYCVWHFWLSISTWNVLWKICSSDSATRTEGTSCCRCQWCWENCVRSQGASFEGDWGIIVLVHCFLYIVSSSVSVSIFYIIWLNTFWTLYNTVSFEVIKIFQNYFAVMFLQFCELNKIYCIHVFK